MFYEQTHYHPMYQNLFGNNSPTKRGSDQSNMMNMAAVTPERNFPSNQPSSSYRPSYPQFTTHYRRKRDNYSRFTSDSSRAISNVSSNEDEDVAVKQQVENPSVICRCVKSRCLKLYCDCFQAEVLCNTMCKCLHCLNTEAENKKGGRLKLAKRDYLLRKPHSFGKKKKKLGDGCACKNNR